MSEFHDDYPQYELMAHHSEEEGKAARKGLVQVFLIMLAVTIVELVIGFMASQWGLLNEDRTSSVTLKFIFIILTLLKAWFIVYKFMHLSHERKFMKYSVIVPYTIFIVYLIFIIVGEANYSLIHKDKMDQIIVDQKAKANKDAKEGHHEGGEHHEGGHEEGHEGGEHH